MRTEAQNNLQKRKSPRSKLRQFLDKGHRPFCQIKNFDNPHCTCGLEAAIREYEEIMKERLEK